MKYSFFDFQIDMIFKERNSLFIMDFGVNNLAFFDQYSTLENIDLEKIYQANQPPEFLKG